MINTQCNRPRSHPYDGSPIENTSHSNDNDRENLHYSKTLLLFFFPQQKHSIRARSRRSNRRRLHFTFSCVQPIKRNLVRFSSVTTPPATEHVYRTIFISIKLHRTIEGRRRLFTIKHSPTYIYRGGFRGQAARDHGGWGAKKILHVVIMVRRAPTRINVDVEYCEGNMTTSCHYGLKRISSLPVGFYDRRRYTIQFTTTSRNNFGIPFPSKELYAFSQFEI